MSSPAGSGRRPSNDASSPADSLPLRPSPNAPYPSGLSASRSSEPISGPKHMPMLPVPQESSGIPLPSSARNVSSTTWRQYIEPEPRKPLVRETAQRGFYRVAAGELRPLPLVSAPLPAGMLSSWQLNRIKTATSFALDRNGIEKPRPFDNLTREEPIWDSAWAGDDDDRVHDEHPNIAVVNRHSPGNPENAKLTVLIDADWKNSSPSDWPSAVLEIQRSLGNISTRFEDMEVEIRAAFIGRQCFVFPIRDDEALQSNWNSTIRDTCNKILESSHATRGHVNAVILSRFGFFCHPTKNPITLYVALSRSSRETMWHQAVDKLKEYLKTLPRTIEIFFQHNDWDCSAFQLVSPKPEGLPERTSDEAVPYQKRVNLGADISASIYPLSTEKEPFYPLMGTLGCYVKVKYKRENLVLALTNYHVIRPLLDGYHLEYSEGVLRQNIAPAEGTDLSRADREGVKVQMAGDPLKIEHPSRRRHNHRMAKLQREIDRKKKGVRTPKAAQLVAKLEQEKLTCQAFFDNGDHDFGRVWAASGFCRRTPPEEGGRYLDWALIRVRSGRQGTNTLPDDATWNRLAFASKPPDIVPTLRKFELGASIKTMMPNTEVYKMGAASGPTAGTSYQYRHEFTGVPESRYLLMGKTEEYKFLPHEAAPGQGLGSPGDSGAAVYNEEGQVVGLLFRGLDPNVQFRAEQGTGKPSSAAQMPYTLVTPIEDVFNDIKKMTGVSEISLL